MIKYQDRILYGTDVTIPEEEPEFESKSRDLAEKWRSNWIYLATDSTQQIKYLPGKVKGLHLPKRVVDKIFHKNADRYFTNVKL